MSFNSLVFLLIFLPLYFLCIYLLNKKFFNKKKFLIFVTIIFSFIFYGYYSIDYLIIFILSIAINYFISNYFFKKYISRKFLLFISIIFNLSILAIFKYYNFFIDNINLYYSLKIDYVNLILPIGISFFTFQQISYHVDIYKKKINNKKISFINYSLYVSFFPQLVAGPILRFNEFVFEITKKSSFIYNYKNISIGLVIIILALSKKLILADNLGIIADDCLREFKSSQNISFYNSWLLIFSFSMQIYFDFSAYSEIAIGICKIININIPANFNSPFQATNFIDFWRRWHITLSNFFRDYFYVPLGGNKNNLFSKCILIFIIMSVVGFWHGASWNFILWGSLHGFFIVLNHLINDIKKFNLLNNIHFFLKQIFIFVTTSVLFVFFKVVEFKNAIYILESAMGFNQLHILNVIEISALNKIIFGLSFIICLFFPNLFSFLNLKIINIKKKSVSNFIFNFNYLYLILLFFLIIICGYYLSFPKSFIYFQF